MLSTTMSGGHLKELQTCCRQGGAGRCGLDGAEEGRGSGRCMGVNFVAVGFDVASRFVCLVRLARGPTDLLQTGGCKAMRL